MFFDNHAIGAHGAVQLLRDSCREYLKDTKAPLFKADSKIIGRIYFNLEETATQEAARCMFPDKRAAIDFFNRLNTALPEFDAINVCADGLVGEKINGTRDFRHSVAAKLTSI
jgi:hypothetical protein